MSGWKKFRFSDFVEINPPVKFSPTGTISFVEMKDLENGKRFCAPSTKRKITSGSRFNEGDTLFARITPCLENGKICQVRGLENDQGFGSTEFLVFRGKKDISDTDFVFYLSRWRDVRDHAEINLDGTSGRQRVPKECFSDLTLNLPSSLSEQKAIVEVLSSLDNKIDLLCRQNVILEKLAETLFRKYFIEDADAKWPNINLLDVIELVGGGTPKTSIPEYWDGDIPWLSGGDIASNHKTFAFKSEKSISLDGVKHSSAKLLPKFSTVISARGTVGKFCLLSKPMAFSQSNYGIMPTYKNCYFFTYLLISSTVSELQTGAYGSVFDTITTNTFKNCSVFLPEKTVICDFEKHISIYFNKIFSNSNQIQTLTKLRDTLLPRLMSGEIRTVMR